MARVRVLVADDNKAMRDVLTSILSEKLDIIHSVGDGGSALAGVKQLLPDVAILDICMPVLSGIEVARRLRDTKSNVAVVLVTACLDADTFQAAEEAGCLGYVLKPRLLTDLLAAVNLALRGARFASPGAGNLVSSI